MQRVEAYRVEIPIVATDEYSGELSRASKAIDAASKKASDGAKAQDGLARSSKDVAKSQDSVSKSTRSAAKGVDEVGRSADQSERSVRRTSKTFESFGNKVKALQRAKATVEVAVRDNATRVLDRVRGAWDSFRYNPITRLTVSAVDRAMSVLRGIKNTVLSIPTMITIGLSYVGIKNLSEATVGAAMNWERYEVSMEHWLGGNVKQAKELTKWMGEFADITPFSSPELFPALTTAVSMSNKDIGKSKKLLKIAADMAALTPGATPEDSMSALFNASVGNTTRMKAYGMVEGVDDIKKMGGFDKYLDKVAKTFAGGAEKLSKTAAGVIATLKGYRGSFMRSIGTGFLEPMKPRLDAINIWLENNQDKWGQWKSVAMGHGKDLSEGIFSTLEKSFGHIQSRYLENPDFMNLDLKGKFTFITSDVKEYLSGTVKPQLMEWWDETGSGVALGIGKSIGSGIVEGIKIGMQAGGELLTSSYSDLATNLKETGLSKETGKSATMVAATTIGAGYLAKKLIYDPAKSIFNTGKGITGWFGGAGGSRGTGGTSQREENRRARQAETRSTRESRPRPTPAPGSAPYPTLPKWINPQSWKVTRTPSDRTLPRTGPAPGSAPYPTLPKWMKDSKFSKGASSLLKQVPLISAGVAALTLVGSTKDTIVGDVGMIGGGLAGAKYGAMGGAFLGPAGAVGGGILGSILGATFGEKIFSSAAKFLAPHKASAAELPVDMPMGYEEYPGGRRKPGTSEHPMTSARVPDLGSFSGVGADGGLTVINQHAQNLASTLSSMNEKAQGILHNFSSLTMVTGESVGWVVGAFQPLQDSTTVLRHNIDATTMVLGESASWITGAFYPLSEGTLAHNANALSITLGESVVTVASSFMPLASTSAVLNQNTSALSLTIGESAGHVVGAFHPLTSTGPTMNQNASALSTTLGMAAGWVSGIQSYAQSVKSALSNLASRISNVPTPSVGGTSIGNSPGGKVTPYARGGIARSPHLGLVAEAGVPEAMIPWDGSSRSKALWQQTGEALGMFGGGSASGGGGNAAVATSGMAGGSSGATFNFGDITIPASNNWSAEEILNMITPALYEKIVAALAKR